MAGPYSFQTRVSAQLASDMAAGANACTLKTAAFGTPTRKMILTIDGDVSNKTADFECSVNGTAVSSMVLLNGPDVIHTADAQVWAGLVDEHTEGWTDFTGTTANVAWTAYTPVWTSTGAAPTIGNGSLTGAYVKIGKLVIGRLRNVFGSTGSPGSGTYLFTLPFTAVANTTYQNIGSGTLVDSGTGVFITDAHLASATQMSMSTAAGELTNINPITFTTNDIISVHFMYEAA